jgi:hypothetical protein
MKKYLILSSVLLALFFVLPIITNATTGTCLKEGEEKSLMPLSTGSQDSRVCCAGLVFKSTLPICPGCVAEADVDTCVKNPGTEKLDPVTLDPVKYKLYLTLAEIKKQIFLLEKQIMILLRLQKASTSSQPVACTMEAKICPDGKTYVGRQGLKCEFAPCPTSTSMTVSAVASCKGRDEIKCHPGTTTQGIWINQDNPANWPTYKNEKYGFEVRYPGDWKITDNSSVVAINNLKNTAIQIESPSRLGLAGYEKSLTSYRIMIYLDELGKVVSIANFGGGPEFSRQSWWNISIPETVKKATPEYKIGERIILTFKLTK